jgi:hypothetical protein
MRCLKVIYPDGQRVWVGECPAEYLLVFGEALSELFQLQAEIGDPVVAFNDPAVVGLIKFVSSVLPVLPFRREAFSIDPFLSPLDIGMLSEFFYGADCRVAQLHAPTEEATPPLDQNDYTVENMPIMPSGNAIADLLARLSRIDNSTANAQKLMQTYDMGTLNALVQQVGELQRDPKERFEEYKKKRLEATVAYAQEHDMELYSRIMGLNIGETNGSADQVEAE